jgi:hypothetical protein
MTVLRILLSFQKPNALRRYAGSVDALTATRGQAGKVLEKSGRSAMTSQVRRGFERNCLFSWEIRFGRCKLDFGL